MRRTAATIVALGVLGTLPAGAAARSYTAYAGDPGKVPSSAPPSTELNQFFPKSIKVRAGDKVEYVNNSFHTVSILGKGEQRPPLAIPDPAGGTYAALNDPAGNPFIWSGKQKFIYNPAAFLPKGSTTVDDRKTHSSGAYTPGPSGPGKYTLKYARPGSYRVLCLIHPGMQQRVKVLKAKARGADSVAKVKAAAAKQSSKSYKDAGKAAKEQPPNASTVLAGVERKQAALLAFLPQSLTVPAGTTVDFVNASPSEVHNMVFGPADYVQAFSEANDKIPLFGPENQVAPPFIYGSQAPVQGVTYSYAGNEHGNGFLWTPLMDGQPGDPPKGLPSTERITFTTPGSYGYFCAIHGPTMSGTIVVQ